MASGVHSAVRETYHDAMLRHKTQHEAFDLAFALVLRRLVLAPGTARRVLAVMLANEPSVPGSLSFEAASDEAVMPPARRSERTNTEGAG